MTLNKRHKHLLTVVNTFSGWGEVCSTVAKRATVSGTTSQRIFGTDLDFLDPCNQIMEETIRNKLASKRQPQGADSSVGSSLRSFPLPWLLHLLGPLISILLIIMTVPCIFGFLQEKITELAQCSVNQMFLMRFPQVFFSHLPTCNPALDHHSRTLLPQRPNQHEVPRGLLFPLS